MCIRDRRNAVDQFIYLELLGTATDHDVDDDETGEDTYVLGEINCSCVGFTSELDMGIQEMVADEAIKRVEEKHA